MIKRILALSVVFTVLFSVLTFAAGTNDEIGLVINGERIQCDVSPTIIDGRTLVPVRVIFDSFGADVIWNGNLRQVVISTKTTVMIFNIGSKVAYVNSVAFNIDVAPVIVNGRTLIPVRFISERMGYNVVWNGTDRMVYITNPKSESDDMLSEEQKPGNSSQNTDDGNDKINSGFADLDKITVSNSADSCSVRVSLSEKVVPDEMQLSSPDRIVLDFKNVNQLCNDEKHSLDNSDIIQIRWAYHENYTRLVIETRKKLDYTLKYTSTSCTVVIEKENKDREESLGDITDSDDSASSEKREEDIFSPPILDSSAPIVVIDAGHGGYDAGAVGKNEDGEIVVYEKEVNLKIALGVEKKLKADGINVVMTRSTDKALGSTVMEDLVTRAEIANRVNADLFISVHNNAFTNPEATGTSVLYPGLSNSGGYGITSKELAENIQKLLVKATGLKDRGIVESPEMVVLKRTMMPAVLLECAFVTGLNDQKILTDNKKIEDISDAVYKGIINSLRRMGKVK